MSTFNGKPYSTPKNITLSQGLLRFGATNATNPFGDLTYGLYVDGSGNLIYRNLTNSVTLGAAGTGGGSAPSWDAIYNGDQTMLITGNTLTFDRNAGNGDVLTITNSGAGSGDCIQITNVGTGSDIKGTAGTWSFSKAGDGVCNMLVMAGDAGSDSLTLTAGDVVISDGSITLTDADNTHSLSITNNSAAADSLVEFKGSGAFTGTTTTSFFTITPSGLQSGTAVYVPLAAITTGVGIDLAGGTTQTSGNLFVISSSAAGITDTEGALLHATFAGVTTTSGVLVGIDSNATDETIMLKLTNSDVAAAGRMIVLSASAMTTGSGIVMADLDSLTDGIGVSIISASTALTATGRLFSSSHTGASGTNAVLNEFITTATDETILLQVKNATAGQTTGTLLKVASSGYTTGYTGDVVSISGTSTTGAATVLKVTSGVTTTNGSAVSILAEGLTTGVGLKFAHTTSVIADGGSMVRLSDSGVATGGATNATILDIINTGSVAGTLVRIKSNLAAQTATCLLDVVASGYTTGYTGSVVTLTGCSTTGSGTVLSVTSANTTAGGAVLVTSGATTTNGYALKVLAEGLTTGTGILFAHTTSVIADGGSMLRLTDSGVATGGATNGVILDILTTGSVAGTLVQIKSNLAAQTTTKLLNVVAAGYTTGYTGSVVSFTGCSTTGSGSVLTVTSANSTAGTAVSIVANSVTTGTALKISAVEATLTSGLYIQCYDGAASDFSVGKYGATTIAGNAIGTAALTISAGDLVLTSGSINVSGKFITSGIETIAAGGTTTAANLAKTLHSVDSDAGGDIVTLADGTIGQLMYFACPSATGTLTITPANLAGGTSVTLNAEGDTVILQFVDTQWYIMGGNGYAVV
jgi:hypothetical protein